MAGFIDFVKNIFSAGAADLADKTFNGLDSLITSKEELAEQEVSLLEVKQAIEKARQDYKIKMKELELDTQEAYLNDKQSARGMYQKDSSIQKILTILFTVGYFGITTFMFTLVMKMFDMDLNDFVVSFVSSIFGAFNAIMVQIISFYFGSSKSGEDTGAAIAESFNNINK